MKLRRIVPIAVSLALVAGGLAVAGPGRYRDENAVGPRLQHLARELDLTDGQKARIKEIVEAHRAAGLGDAARSSRLARRDLRLMIHDPAADESAIRNAATRVAQTEGDLAVERHKMFGEIYQLLTPEQQEKAKALRERAMDRRRDIQ